MAASHGFGASLADQQLAHTGHDQARRHQHHHHANDVNGRNVHTTPSTPHTSPSKTNSHRGSRSDMPEKSAGHPISLPDESRTLPERLARQLGVAFAPDRDRHLPVNTREGSGPVRRSAPFRWQLPTSGPRSRVQEGAELGGVENSSTTTMAGGIGSGRRPENRVRRERWSSEKMPLTVIAPIPCGTTMIGRPGRWGAQCRGSADEHARENRPPRSCSAEAVRRPLQRTTIGSAPTVQPAAPSIRRELILCREENLGELLPVTSTKIRTTTPIATPTTGVSSTLGRSTIG